MTPAELAVASFVVAIASVVQGAVGFGLVLIAAPIVTIIDPRLVPGPMLVCAFVLTVVMSARDWQGMDVRGVWVAFVGRIPGSLLGAWLLAQLTPDSLELVVGVTVLVGVAMTAGGFQVPVVPWTLLTAGFLAGVMGTTTAIGGPPIAIVYQHHPGIDLRGTLSGFFVIGSLLSIAMLALYDRFGWQDVWLGVALLPATLVGYALSGPAARVLDQGYTRVAVLGVSTLAALVLLVRRLA